MADRIVWGGQATVFTDANFVAPGAVAWLRLPMGGVQEGPTGGDTMTATTFIQRVNTAGGVAPSTGCSGPAEVGAKAFEQVHRRLHLLHGRPQEPGGIGRKRGIHAERGCLALLGSAWSRAPKARSELVEIG